MVTEGGSSVGGEPEGSSELGLEGCLRLRDLSFARRALRSVAAASREA